jgi:hypothetical protein
MAKAKTTPPAAGRKANKAAGDAPKRRWYAQMWLVFTVTRQRDKRLVPYMLLAFVITFGALFGIGWALGSPIIYGVFGLLIAVLVALIIMSRRAQTGAYRQLEGQPGAAAAVIDGMRGDWRLTPNVAVTRHQDLVHRVVGKPGVVLIGEGDTARVAALFAQERKRINRVAAETPIYELQVGSATGQIPVSKLQTKLNRLPRNLKGRTIDAVEGRMRALGGANNVPLPKGPLPRNARLPKGGPKIR